MTAKILYIINLTMISLNCCIAQNDTSFNFSFDQIQNGDTLKIVSEIMDRGEFGPGHLEKILVYYSGGLTAKLIREAPENGFNEYKYLDPDKPFRKIITLSEENKDKLLNYISKYVKYKDDPYLWCNAPSRNLIKFKDKKVNLYDDDCKWNKLFLELRDSLFQSAAYKVK